MREIQKRRTIFAPSCEMAETEPVGTAAPLVEPEPVAAAEDDATSSACGSGSEDEEENAGLSLLALAGGRMHDLRRRDACCTTWVSVSERAGLLGRVLRVESDGTLAIGLADGSEQIVTVRQDSVAAVKPEHAVTQLLEAWLLRTPRSDTFSLPHHDALPDEVARKRERHLMNSLGTDVLAATGRRWNVDFTRLNSHPEGHPSRRVVFQLIGAGVSEWDSAGSSSAQGLLACRAPSSSPPTHGVAPLAHAADDDLRSMLWDDVCALLEALERVGAAAPTQPGAATVRRRALVAEFWRGGESDAAPPRHERSHLSQVFRLLLPHHDPRRYYLAASQVAQVAARSLGLGAEQTKDVRDSWRATGVWSAATGSSAADQIEPCDLATAICREFGRRVRANRSTRTLTVGQLNESLDRCDRGHSERGSGKLDLLRGLFERCCAREAKWLVRVVQRDHRIGERVQQPVPQKGEWPKLVMDGFCRSKGRVGTPSNGNPPRMYSFFRHQHDLRHVCAVAEAGRLPSVYPPPCQLGVHVRCQGSSPCRDTSGAAVASELGTPRVYVETKYDGFRLQVHWSDERATFFYRSGINCTADVAPDLLPALRLALGREQTLDGERYSWLRRAWRDAGTAAAAQRPRVTSAIFDGELLVYDEAPTPAGFYDEIGSRPGVVGFGTAFWVKVKEVLAPGAGARVPVGGLYSKRDCQRHYLLKVFDILSLDGRDLVQEGTPLEARKALLASALTPVPNYVEPVECSLVDLEATPRAVSEAFELARAEGEEGLMLKAAHRPYVPNARAHTLKLKAEFIPGLGDTVTLFVVGGRMPRAVGRGGSAGSVCEFALAARPGTAGADGEATGAGELMWLANTSGLCWQDGMPAVEVSSFIRRWLNDEDETDADGLVRPAVMRRLRTGEDPPGWLRHAPVAEKQRLHFVLHHPRDAIPAEVVGSRFLRRCARAWSRRRPRRGGAGGAGRGAPSDPGCAPPLGPSPLHSRRPASPPARDERLTSGLRPRPRRFTNDAEALAAVPFKLRFPRIKRFFDGDARAGVVVDTVATFHRKACGACLLPEGRSWESVAAEMRGEARGREGDALASVVCRALGDLSGCGGTHDGGEPHDGLHDASPCKRPRVGDDAHTAGTAGMLQAGGAVVAQPAGLQVHGTPSGHDAEYGKVMEELETAVQEGLRRGWRKQDCERPVRLAFELHALQERVAYAEASGGTPECASTVKRCVARRSRSRCAQRVSHKVPPRGDSDHSTCASLLPPRDAGSTCA